MEYDRQGHLLWATAGTRAWIASQAQKAPAPERRRTPGWVFAIVGAAVVLVVLVVLVAVMPSDKVATTAQPAEKDSGAAAGVPAKSLVTVFTWPGGGKGNDIRSSAPFALQGGHQVVTFAATALPGEYSDPVLGWAIQGVDGGLELLEPASFGNTRSDLYLPAGSYYLSSNTVDCTWSLTVSEER